MFTMDQAGIDRHRENLRARNEVLRELMFGANGVPRFDADPAPYTLDAAVVATFTQQMLEYIDNTLEMKDYPETTFRRVFSLKTDIPAGADTFTRYEFEANGKADWIDENGFKIPMLEVGTTPTSRGLIPCGHGFSITRTEILRATQARVPISTEKPAESRRVVEEMLDRVYWLGDTVRNVPGLLTHASIPLTNAVTGAWVNPATTAAQIETDILTALNARLTETGLTTVRYRIVLPTAPYLRVTQTRLGDYHTETIAQYLTRQIDNVEGFDTSKRLDGAAADGDNIACLIPVGSEWGYGLHSEEAHTEGPERKLLGDKYGVIAKTGGFWTLKPRMFGLLEGV